MAKKLNITNFVEMSDTLGATKRKEMDNSYVLIYDVKKSFSKALVFRDPTTLETLNVDKLIVVIGKDIDFDTNPKKPLIKLTFIMADAFNDALDKMSFLIEPAKLKEKLIQLIKSIEDAKSQHN